MPNNLPPWVRKWWDVANDRRGTLIHKKHLGSGLTKAQEQELDLLQRVAEAVISVYTSPFKDGPTITPEEIEEALAKGAAGAKELQRKLDAVFRPALPGEGPVLR